MDLVAARVRGVLLRRRYPFASVRRRQCVVQEVCETELSFVGALQALQTVFKEPLLAAAVRDDVETVLPRVMVEGLFPGLETLCVAGCRVANIFADCAARWKHDSCFAGVFEHAVGLMMPLAEYTLGYERQRALLAQAGRMAPASRWLAQQGRSPALRGLSLGDMLIMPVQRLMRYPILLAELIKATPQSHPDHAPLLEARSRFARFVANINARSKLHDALLDAAAAVCALPAAVQPWSYCVCHGRVFVNSFATPSVGILFSDRFCWMAAACRFELPDAACHFLLHERSAVLRLEDVDAFGPSPETPRALEVHTRGTITLLVFPEDEDIEQWVVAFQWVLGFFPKARVARVS